MCRRVSGEVSTQIKKRSECESRGHMMMMMIRTVGSLFLLLHVALSEKEHLEIVDDPRTAFSIESFGFVQGGSVKVRRRRRLLTER